MGMSARPSRWCSRGGSGGGLFAGARRRRRSGFEREGHGGREGVDPPARRGPSRHERAPGASTESLQADFNAKDAKSAKGWGGKWGGGGLSAARLDSDYRSR